MHSFIHQCNQFSWITWLPCMKAINIMSHYMTFRHEIEKHSVLVGRDSYNDLQP